MYGIRRVECVTHLLNPCANRWWQALEQARMKQVVEDTEKQFEEFDKVFTEMKESQGTDDLDAVVNNFIES